MKRSMSRAVCAAAVCTILSVCSLDAFAVLKTGDKAPDFTAEASLGGKTYAYSLADALKKGPVVLMPFS